MPAARSSVAGLDADARRALSLTPPDRFVAARNELAKQYRADGRREDAAAIAALRRPTWIDWAIATCAAVDPEPVAAFAEAAATMRSAQDDAVQGRGTDVAAALRELRSRMSTLARRADRVLIDAGRHGELAALVERLTEIAASAEATGELCEGLVATPTAEPEPEPEPEPGARAQERRALVRTLAEVDRSLEVAARHIARAERTVDELAAKRDAAAAAAARANEEHERALARVADAEAALAALRADAERDRTERVRVQRELDALAASDTNHQQE